MLRIAVIGFGRLGRACARAILQERERKLTGIVRRPERVHEPLPGPYADVPRFGQPGEPRDTPAALVCVPTEQVIGTVREVRQAGMGAVECAALQGCRHYAYSLFDLPLGALWGSLRRQAVREWI